MLKKIVTLASAAFVFATLIGLAATQPASAEHNDNHDNDKVTICHRTNSATNPYTSPSVSVNAADGVAGNSGRQPDHYGEHKGPVASSFLVASFYKAFHIEWGDIIPPIPGKHNGLNWTTVGQAIYYNGCNYPKTAAASVSVTPATCESGEILVYGNIVNATFSGTANGTVGPTDYSVTATANQDSLFASNSATKLFEGSLDGPLAGEQCDPELLEASASVFVNPATCESAEIATVNTLVNASLTNSTGTTGPGDYEFQFTADQGAAFAGNESSLTLTGTLQGPLTGEQCEEPEEDVANIKYGIVCSTAGAVVTFTNTGTVSGDVTLNGEVITVAAGETIERTLDTTDAGLQVVVVIDGQTVYDQLVTCDTGDVLGDTDTPAVLPYTSGDMTAALVAVIASVAATVGLISVASRSLLTRQ